MRNYVIALYIRLSVEDFKTESLSIPNQKLILREKAMSLPEWDNSEILEFIDNGHTGTNFERPAVQELLTMVQAGKINCIIVKDLSRFGRNSIETGYFIERVFPLYHTRFISVSDDFDTANFKGDTGGIDIAFKYLISECYSRDMSMKTKSAKYAKMSRGEYQSVICPYGYRKSADGRMEPDEDVDLETYRTRKAVYDTELVQAKNVHAVITAQTKQIKSDYEIKLKQQEIMQEVGNANMLTKALIDRLINKVYVFPGERIEIEYATQDFLETKESEKEV